MSEFGPTLKDYRERHHLSQSKLADLAGFDHSTISRLESGERNPTRDAVNRLAAALKLTLDEHDRMMRSAGFAGDSGVVPLTEFRAWLDEGIALLTRAQGGS